MKELTMDEKIALLAEVNKLLASISGYQLTIPMRELEHNDIFITDKGCIKRLYLEYGEICNVFLGETREEAIASIAHKWAESYSSITSPELLWPNEKYLSEFDKIEHFRAHCDFYIFKSIDQASLIYMTDFSPAFDAINQKAADILRKITAYDVPLIRLRNNTSSSQLVWWYKKEGTRWLYCTFEQEEFHKRNCAENDDEMIYNTVYRSLANYAQRSFVELRDGSGKDSYWQYEDFMERCLHMAYPEQKYHRQG